MIVAKLNDVQGLKQEPFALCVGIPGILQVLWWSADDNSPLLVGASLRKYLVKGVVPSLARRNNTFVDLQFRESLKPARLLLVDKHSLPSCV
jgi:hypothetical protein